MKDSAVKCFYLLLCISVHFVDPSICFYPRCPGGKVRAGSTKIATKMADRQVPKGSADHFEVQVYGMSGAADEFELKLRAAGASEPVRFTVEESVWTVPAQHAGAVQDEVRLVPRLPPNWSIPELETISRGEDHWVLVHEAEVPVEKEEIVRVVQADRISMNGKAPDVLKQLGFVEKFQIGRSGTRVKLPGGWMVEYFSIYDPQASATSSNKRRRMSFVLDKARTGWVVAMSKAYDSERDTPANIADAWRLVRRMMPDLQVAPKIEFMARERKITSTQ